MAKKNDKKKDAEADREIKAILISDIELLEKKIYYEQEKTVTSKRELERIIKQIKDEQTSLDNTKNSEDKRILLENETLKESIKKYSTQVKQLEKDLEDKDAEIERLEKEIIERAAQYEKELEDKDASNKEQQKMFDEMSQRFQSILQRTTNKLQERVNMGN
jgi:hypothetical protein